MSPWHTSAKSGHTSLLQVNNTARYLPLLGGFHVKWYLTHLHFCPSLLLSILYPPPLFLSHPLLLVFCWVLVKSQLATVSRSLAALTMASGIMLNTAPRLSPHRPASATPFGAHRKEMEGSQWRCHCNYTSAFHRHPLCLLFLLSHPPFPTFFFTFLLDSLLKCSLISCSSFIMHAHFEFAWIHFPDASAAILTYNDVYCCYWILAARTE